MSGTGSEPTATAQVEYAQKRERRENARRHATPGYGVFYDVTGWSEEWILEVVQYHKGSSASGFSYRIDSDDQAFIAVLVNFDRPKGVIEIDGVSTLVGEDRVYRYNRYLYITPNARVLKGNPDVRFIHRVQGW